MDGCGTFPERRPVQGGFPESMTTVLGISALLQDASVALLRDGELVASELESRFSSRPRDATFPFQAIEFCLAESGIEAGAIDYLCFSGKVLTKLDRLIEKAAVSK